MFSRIIRRVHLYLALFLAPWLLMYAVSTLTMNHREFFKTVYGAGPPAFEKERELSYAGTFPDNAEPKVMAEQILVSLGMEGAHRVRRAKDGTQLTIDRFEPLGTRRLTYTPADGRVIIEREAFQGPAFLERMHRRRGFQSDYPLEDAWALSVDLVIFAMVFWSASGIWMWWEMKAARTWGLLAGTTGLALFALFLLTI